jgi:hypothetical protein
LLTEREKVEWSVTRLEARASAGVAINEATHVFFASSDGWVRGESRLVLDNQGASGLTLPLQAEPTYVGLNGEDLYLTSDPSDPDKDLWVPMGLGSQQLVIQHARRFRRALGLGLARLDVPALPAPATTARFEVRYPEEWYPAAWSFLSRWGVAAPSRGAILGWLLLVLWSERTLAFLRLSLRRRLALAVLLGAAAMAWGGAALALVLAALVVSALWAAIHVRRWGWQPPTVILAVLAVGVGLLILMALSVPSLMRSRSSATLSSAEYSAASPPARGKVAPGALEEEPHGPSTEGYQGLPAKMVIPSGVRRARFAREMLAPDTSRAATILMVSSAVVSWATALLVLAALVLLWRARRVLGEGWRARVQEWRDAEKPAAAPPGAEG